MGGISFIENKTGSKKNSPNSDNSSDINWTRPEPEPKTSGSGKTPQPPNDANVAQKRKAVEKEINQPAPKPNLKNAGKQNKKGIFSIFQKDDPKEKFKKQKADIAQAKNEAKKAEEKEHPPLDLEAKPEEQKDIRSMIRDRIKESNIKIGGEVVKTNLIAGEDTIIIDWNKNILMLISAVILAVIITGSGYVYLYFKEQKDNETSASLSFEIETLEGQLERARGNVKQIDIFQNKMGKIRSLLDRHIYWSNFFEFLEKYTLKDVYIEGGFEGSPEDSFDLNMKAPDFKSVTNQITAFKSSPMVKSAQVESATFKEEEDPEKGVTKEVDFTLKLEVDESILYK